MSLMMFILTLRTFKSHSNIFLIHVDFTLAHYWPVLLIVLKKYTLNQCGDVPLVTSVAPFSHSLRLIWKSTNVHTQNKTQQTFVSPPHKYMHIPRPFRDPRTSGLVFAERAADSRPSYAPFGMVCECVCVSLARWVAARGEGRLAVSRERLGRGERLLTSVRYK